MSERGDREGSEPEREVPPAWIRTVPVPSAEGELAEVYARIGARGRIARILGVQSLHPAGLEAHVALYRTLMFGPSPLSRVEREALAVVTSSLNDCFY